MKFEMRKKNAKNSKLLIAFIAGLLFISIFTAIPAFSVQPPLAATTYYKGTIGQPSRLDPARAYDTASCELIQNVYETLIWYADSHPITFTPGVGYNLSLADYADLTKFQPRLSTFVPNQTNGCIVPDGTGGAYWTFEANTAATWQPWIAANGSTIPSRPLTAYDIVYTFQRMLVLENSGSPNWMFFMPGFGHMGFRTIYAGYANGTLTTVADENDIAHQIQNFVYLSGGNNVTFHFQYAWAPVPMYQIFAQTWGSIVQPEFCMEHGDWDGLFTNSTSDSDMSAGWSNNYRRKPTSKAGPLDTYKTPAIYGVHGSKYTTGNHDVPAMLGTGPYNFTNWDQVSKTWRIDQWTGYWRGWAGNHVTTVIVKGVDPWPTRKMMFLIGDFDEVYVPPANMYDLLAGDAYTPIPGVNLVYNIAQLSMDSLFFTMHVSVASPYQAYVGYPTHKTGPVAEFFANEHMRRAFAWSFNYTEYIQEAYYGEAIQPASWCCPGPIANSNSSMPLRNLNYTVMLTELYQAAIGGFNVGVEGFELTLAYNIGNDQRKIAAQMIAEAFATLGSKYKVNVVGLDWPVFLDAMNAMQMPAFCQGWLADFAHPDTFARAYMHSWGAFPSIQGPPFPPDQAMVDAEIDAAIIEPDEATQIWYYQDLQYRYWQDIISFPLVQPIGRRWARDWVYGWYFNSLYPGGYYYDYYKSVAGTAEPVNLDVIHTLTPINTWQRVYWYANGCALVGYTEGTGPATGARAIYKFSLSMDRTDANTNVPTLVASVGLKRLDLNNSNPSTNLFFTSVQQILLSPGETKIVALEMEEDGTYVDFFPANHTFQLSAVAAVYSPGNAYDNNLADNTAVWGNFKTQGPVTGDFKIDGTVNILDSIVLGLNFNKKQGDPDWDPLIDVKADGIINILDSIVLGLNFSIIAPGPKYP